MPKNAAAKNAATPATGSAETAATTAGEAAQAG